MDDWHKVLQNNFRSWEKLADFLELSLEQRKQVEIGQNVKFPLNLPLRIAQKIPKKKLDDPLLIQFLPSIQETEKTKGFTDDPVKDATFKKKGALLQKYNGRVLFITTGVCPMHCRFCFRQNYDYGGDKTFAEELSLIAENPTIEEVILSGGDPLSLPTSRLNELFANLRKIPHVKVIRFHSRYPIGIPERIDAEFCMLIQEAGKQVLFVLHANHERELDEEVLQSMKRLQRAGAVTLSQTVLLKGVNDNFLALKALFTTLSQNGILPYYLHQLDPVQGSVHFQVAIQKGKELMRALSEALPGYAVPKYVQEIAGEKNKTAIEREGTT